MLVASGDHDHNAGKHADCERRGPNRNSERFITVVRASAAPAESRRPFPVAVGTPGAWSALAMPFSGRWWGQGQPLSLRLASSWPPKPPCGPRRRGSRPGSGCGSRLQPRQHPPHPPSLPRPAVGRRGDATRIELSSDGPRRHRAGSTYLGNDGSQFGCPRVGARSSGLAAGLAGPRLLVPDDRQGCCLRVLTPTALYGLAQAALSRMQSAACGEPIQAADVTRIRADIGGGNSHTPWKSPPKRGPLVLVVRHGFGGLYLTAASPSSLACAASSFICA
jgi:hypothetical protein